MTIAMAMVTASARRVLFDMGQAVGSGNDDRREGDKTSYDRPLVIVFKQVRRTALIGNESQAERKLRRANCRKLQEAVGLLLVSHSILDYEYRKFLQTNLRPRPFCAGTFGGES